MLKSVVVLNIFRKLNIYKAMYPKSKRIHVMKAFEPYMRTLCIFDTSNYHGHNFRTIIGNIIFAIMISFSLIVSFPIIIVCGAWLCVDLHFDLNKISSTVPITIHTLQYLLVYISFALRSSEIQDLINRLQSIVNRRK